MKSIFFGTLHYAWWKANFALSHQRTPPVLMFGMKLGTALTPPRILGLKSALSGRQYKKPFPFSRRQSHIQWPKSRYKFSVRLQNLSLAV
jgi:hypothetical protein